MPKKVSEMPAWCSLSIRRKFWNEILVAADLKNGWMKWMVFLNAFIWWNNRINLTWSIRKLQVLPFSEFDHCKWRRKSKTNLAQWPVWKGTGGFQVSFRCRLRSRVLYKWKVKFQEGLQKELNPEQRRFPWIVDKNDAEDEEFWKWPTFVSSTWPVGR